ncbi:1-deoxy-D-xylulose-5-phosphate reductoisomerase, partial [Desulfovibrio sp. OttesenSCG-928-A18]|nr:1-deoxy-D-xylulose-5-phosphate reductoisomerase [Desulfovibrio sp. OttesenSCG-928-A18]
MPRYISPLPDPAGSKTWPRKLVILGSTGSIGQSALGVLRLQAERFRLLALAGARNIPLLAEQAKEFRPPLLCTLTAPGAAALRQLLPAGYQPEILWGEAGYEALASLPEAHTVLSAQVGAAGLRATWAAAEAGKVIALANKESLVLAGTLLRSLCATTRASILPVDSEHNAIFQCLAACIARSESAADGELPKKRMRAEPHAAGNQREAPESPRRPETAPELPENGLSRLILTASGGPFYGNSPEELERIRPEQALAHPTWKMGAKISIDSATLMNKGLELIEAAHLYGLPMSAIEVLVHRQSIVHSLVEFSDGSLLAQLGEPDMRVPIAYCLGWPLRLNTGVKKLGLAEHGSLSFAEADSRAFPCLALARTAQEHGRGSPVVLNAANEIAVQAFLDGRTGFTGIARLVRTCLQAHMDGAYSVHKARSEPQSVDEIMALDAET